METRDERRAWNLADLALLGVALVWGATFPLVGGAVRDTSAAAFLTLRFASASLLMLPFLRGAEWSPAAWLHGAGLGAIGFAGFWLQTEGLRSTTPSRSAFLTGLAVVLVPLLSIGLLRRVPRHGSLGGAALAASGLALLTAPGLGSWNRGDLLTLGCALAYALYILGVDRATRAVGRRGLRALVAVQLLTTALLAAAALPLEEARLVPGAALWAALLVTVPLATTGSYFLQNWAQARTTPTRTAVILTMEPVFAALFAWSWGGERLGPAALAGGGLIVAGMLVVELR